MDSVDFSKVAISAAGKYRNYLQTNNLGRSIINVRKIKKTASYRYQLTVWQKIVYLDALELAVAPALSPAPIRPSEYKILSYNEKQGYIEVAVGERLEEILAKALPNQITLESDMTFLVKAVQNWYGKFGERISFPQKPRVDVKNIPYPENASEEQKEAIASGLSQPISYIWGAPGTGKTRMVLSGMIYPYIQKNSHVLVMAPTNNALEQSLRGVIEVLREKETPMEKIIRLGRPTSEFLQDYPQVCEKGRMDDLMQRLGNEIQELEHQKAEQEQYARAAEGKVQFEQRVPMFRELQQRVSDQEAESEFVQENLKSAQSIVTELEQSCRVSEGTLNEIRKKLDNQQRYILLSEKFLEFNQIIGGYQERIRANTNILDSLRLQKDSMDGVIAGNLGKLHAAEKEKNLAMAQKAGVRNQIALLFSKKRKEALEAKIEEISAEAERIREELHNNQTVSEELNVRIRQIGDQISRDQTLMQYDPGLFRMASSVFGRILLAQDLGRQFQTELDGYKTFLFDDTLEEKVACEKANLESLEKEWNEARNRLHQCSETYRDSMKRLGQFREKQKVLDQEIKKISISVFEKTLSFHTLREEFHTFFEAHPAVATDPELDDKIKEKQEEYDTLLNNIKAMMKDRNVIACTVDYAMLHYDQLTADTAEHLFVDEAAYCSLIKAGVFFSLGIPVTLLGDHMQLPPVCEMDRKLILDDAKQWECFLWDMSAIYFPDLLSSESRIENFYDCYYWNKGPIFENVKVSFLTGTYRFGEELAKVLDGFIYHQSFTGLGENQTTITVIDAPKKQAGLPFTVSPDEAYAIREYLEKNKLEDFAILAPYKNQVKCLRAKLNLPAERIMTIHASQGREWDTVILSVTDAQKKFFMLSRNIDPPGYKLVNTAVSRARKHLVLVMDYGAWRNRRDELITAIAAIKNEFISHKQ